METHAGPLVRRSSAAWTTAWVLVAVAVAWPGSAAAQELEPGAYWPLPRGLNIFTAVNSLSFGDLTFEPSLPLENGSAIINASVPIYTRAFGLAGRSANLSIQFPIVAGHAEGIYLGEFAERQRFGQGDPRVRLGVNLYGAPAMTPKELAAYRMKTIVGASVTVVPPLGQYNPAQVINIGTNRWSVKTELGLSHAIDKWVVELMGGVWFFTDNDDFAGGKTRSQAPIGGMQAHLTYRFSRSMWLAGDINFYTGGQTRIDGTEKLDLLKNVRTGATFSKALARGHALRMSYSRGAYTTIGGDFTSLAVGYSYAWINK